jgi:arylsulfatase A-like enzyme
VNSRNPEFDFDSPRFRLAIACGFVSAYNAAAAMRRPNFFVPRMMIVIFRLLLCVLWLLPCSLRAADLLAKPNVLFIAIDDLRDWVGALGTRDDVQTPNLDRLAARGVLFTQAYCAAPACNPSRASLMSGVRPSSSGVYDNNQPSAIPLKDKTKLTELFMNDGYLVHGAGKIAGREWHDYFKTPQLPRPTEPPAKPSPYPVGALEGGDEAMGDTAVADYGIAFLGMPQPKPFFLGIGFIKPHLPFYAPRKYFDLYPLDRVQRPKTLDSDLDDVPPAGLAMAKEANHKSVLKANQWERVVQAYLACITYMDGQVGRLLDALDAGPHATNTVVILWSDHGWSLGEKQHWQKFALWEETTRVPLIAVVPGLTEPGRRCDRTVSLMDIYPTLIELCGLPRPAHTLEGRSLVPLLRNPQSARSEPAITTHGRNNHAVRTERWRYIHYADGGEELYDHDADPLEWKNLALDPQFTAVKAELAAWLPKVNAPDAPHVKGGDDGP